MRRAAGWGCFVASAVLSQPRRENNGILQSARSAYIGRSRVDGKSTSLCKQVCVVCSQRKAHAKLRPKLFEQHLIDDAVLFLEFRLP
jgi:hypothetical protein